MAYFADNLFKVILFSARQFSSSGRHLLMAIDDANSSFSRAFSNNACLPQKALNKCLKVRLILKLPIRCKKNVGIAFDCKIQMAFHNF